MLAVRNVLDQLARNKISTIYLDVTHGFRAQSLLAVSAATFARAEWRRQGIGTSPDRPAPAIRVLYGQHDKHAKTTTFWDLTDLLTLADWSAALDAATRFGRADDLGAIAKADEETPWSDRDEQGRARHRFVQELARRVTDFANDLCYNRWQALLVGDGRQPGSASLLARALDPESPGYEAFVTRRPLLADALQALRATAAPLRARSLFAEDAVAASVPLATTYLGMNRFLECAATLREFGFTALAHRLGLQHPQENPVPFRDALGLALARDATPRDEAGPDRARVAAAIDALRAQGGFPEALVEGLRSVGALRNDLLHGGMRPGPTGRDKVAGRLREFIDRHRELAVSTGSNPTP